MVPDNFEGSYIDFNHEISQALRARKDGNEGKARVCARRAAGIVCTVYLHQIGYNLESNSITVGLKTLYESHHITNQAKNLIPHFLIHVTTDHTLPIGADLVQDARQLAKELLGWE